ncbi:MULTISPECIES: hypothetical protein [unclassified Nocardiopsis]|uniref:hypothetical protein n=1 Tax=Nocardiopsis TaxID=2013 RepID=UPI00387AFE44
MVDLAGLALSDVQELGETAIGRALYRVLEEQSTDESQLCATFASEGDDGDVPQQGAGTR